jgi:UDPglucose 6-dehydrogenase
MLATRISVMNELAGLAERVGVGIEMVHQGIGSDPRIGLRFSCMPAWATAARAFRRT